METWKYRHGDMETWRHGDVEMWIHGDTETRRHGDMETWRCGDMESWRQGNGDKEIETWTWGHRDIKRKTENRSSGDFAKSVFFLLIMQTEVCHLSEVTD